MGQPQGRRKKWERRSDTRADELTAAAFELFVRRGFAATRLDDVAAAAGVSKGTVYLYFASKEQLFEAVVRRMIAPNLDKAHALVESFEGTTAELLPKILAFFGERLDGPIPAVAKLVISESDNFPEIARLWTELAFDRAAALFMRVIQRGIDRGELRPVDPAQMAPLIMAPILMVGLWKHSLGKHADRPIDAHATLSRHAETVLWGLCLEPPPKEAS